ncbi:MAG TPA: hypothetical protein VMB21_12125 [Candidatus Limnocylindria bacterium]|jgi:hypothetical protein|nr:hypothetical protein [Candidatus Limnocylindria bacterium]
MRPVPKAAVSASLVGILVFSVVFLVGYFRLLPHQPPHEPGLPWPEDFTSFPPSAAWFTALPCGVLAIPIAFIVALAFFEWQKRKAGGA